MCACLGQLFKHASSRRVLLAAAAGSFVASGVAAAEDAERVAAAGRRAAAPLPGAKARLVLLGTAGGPSFWPDTTRVGTASAVVVGDAAYMVDCGSGSARRFAEAMRATDRPGMRNTQALRTLRALFLTHLHSDHTVDLAALLLYGYFAGLDGPGRGTLQVYGPGRRGELEPVFAIPGAPVVEPDVVAPANPTPGTRDLIDLLLQAYATDVNDRMRDSGRRHPRDLVAAFDIALPEIAGFRSPNATPTPDMRPFRVFEDDRVRVSAILVAHAPIFPAYAYRFDTDEGSVVFSGDTGPCANLVTLARGADVLVHEVIVTSYIDGAYPADGTPAQRANRLHLLRAHTAVEDVGRVAAEAGVGTLVLNHFVPGNATAAELVGVASSFPGRLVIGDDLLEIGLRRRG